MYGLATRRHRTIVCIFIFTSGLLIANGCSSGESQGETNQSCPSGDCTCEEEEGWCVTSDGGSDERRDGTSRGPEDVSRDANRRDASVTDADSNTMRDGSSGDVSPSEDVVPDARRDAARDGSTTPSEWTQLFGTIGKDTIGDVTTDSLGHVYVMGGLGLRVEGRTQSEAFVAQFEPDGTRRWLERLDGDPRAVTTDGRGHLYVAGRVSSMSNKRNPQAFVARFDRRGERQWKTRIGTSVREVGHDVTADQQGRVYMVGRTRGDLNGRRDEDDAGAQGFVAAFDSTGARQWTRLVGASQYSRASAVTTNERGRIHVTGFFTGKLAGESNYGDTDGFVATYAPDGTRRKLEVFGTSGDDYAQAIMVGRRRGWIYVAGDTVGTFSGQDTYRYPHGFLLAMDSAGTRQWGELIGSSEEQRVPDATIGARGELHVAGYTRGGSTGPWTRNKGLVDGFVATFDGNGTRRDVLHVGTPGREKVKAVAADGQGRLYVAGETANSLDGQSYQGGETDVFLKRIR